MPNVDGFDTSIYPGGDNMAWFRDNCGFRYAGFYLAPAPNHGDASWMGQRDALAAAGWGFLPVFVGLQINDMGLSSAAGTQDGSNAAALMRQAGFHTQSICYLDLESGTQPSGGYAAYIASWIAAVNSGNYVAGIYCSHVIAAWCSAQTPYLWTFRIPSGASGQTYPPEQIPQGSIASGGVATQYRQNVFITGNTTQIDINVSLVADPSNLASVMHALQPA
jgi:hypothetical protein